jgi:hypothetical protein
MVDTAAIYWLYWRGRKAFAASRECRRRSRVACHEAQSLHLQLAALQQQLDAELSLSRSRQRRGREPSVPRQRAPRR